MQDKSYEEIKHNERLIAIILRASYTSDKTIFFSPSAFSQQLGYIVYKKDGMIKAHTHKAVLKKVTVTQEVLFIKKGKIVVNFYDNEKKYLTSRELNIGDIIFLCSGGHGFKMLEDTEMVEVKQGPYIAKEKDKDVFKDIE